MDMTTRPPRPLPDLMWKMGPVQFSLVPRRRSPGTFWPGYSGPSTRPPEHLIHLSLGKEKRCGFRFTLQRVAEEIAISNCRFLLNQSDSTKIILRETRKGAIPSGCVQRSKPLDHSGPWGYGVGFGSGSVLP